MMHITCREMTYCYVSLKVENEAQLNPRLNRKQTGITKYLKIENTDHMIHSQKM